MLSPSRTCLALSLLLALAGAPAAASGAQEGKGEELPRLLVMDLLSRGTPPKLSALIAEEVAGALRDTGRFHVVSQDDVRSLLGLEAQRQLLGCEDEGCLTQIAGALGAEQIVTGSSIHVDRVTQVRLKRIDATTAQVLRDVAVGSASADEVLELTRRAAFDLVDATWKPRSKRQVAWAEETLEIGAALRLVSYPEQNPAVGEPTPGSTQAGPVLQLGYAFRSGTFGFGLRLATGVSPSQVTWKDLFGDYTERIELSTVRGGLLLRWPEAGGVWARPYVTAELGVMRVRARSRAVAPPEWLVATGGQRYGAYATLGAGLRFFPRSRIGFAIEAGGLVGPKIDDIVDRDIPVADEPPPAVVGAVERGGIDGFFIMGVLRRAI
ncbi:MAG: hypothetical protein P1V51_15095 [Deltaproteobacteria bacterium]|nr:hypothetical protein [Deltaproteobacteria bacterium]